MANDFYTRIYLETVNIPEDAFKEIVKQSGGDNVSYRSFTIYSQGFAKSMAADIEMWDRIPNDSVWLEERWCAQDLGGYIYCLVRTKGRILYQFTRSYGLAITDNSPTLDELV